MQLEDAPGDPRGGTTTAWSDGQIWRFGGFNGKTEIGGMIDVLPFSDISPNLNRSWSTVPYSKSSNLESLGPGARSVAAIHSFGQDTLMTLFGEGKPSPTGGHDSAGNFWGDVWSFSPSSSSWTERKVEVKDQDVQNGGPGERGWFASDMDLEGGKVVIWGGIDQGNKRLGDGWILSA